LTLLAICETSGQWLNLTDNHNDNEYYDFEFRFILMVWIMTIISVVKFSRNKNVICLSNKILRFNAMLTAALPSTMLC